MWYDDEDEDEGSAPVTPCATSPGNALLCSGGMALSLGSPSSSADLPRNLYLAAPGLIGMGAPTSADHIRNLHALHNVRLVINLREAGNCADDWFEGSVRCVHLPIPSYCAPSMETMLAILGLLRLAHDERATVAVHCLEGKGRTGTVCAAYLLHQHRELAAEEAMTLIRARSPLSIESKEQEDFLLQFARLCQRCGGGAIGEGNSLREAWGLVVVGSEGKLATSSTSLVVGGDPPRQPCRLSSSSSLTSFAWARMDSSSSEEDGSGDWYCS